MAEKILCVPGHSLAVEARQKIVEQSHALMELTSENQRRISSAAWESGHVKIIWHVASCPHCGNETPAYAEYIGKGASDFEAKPQAEISAWVLRQITVFGEQPEVMQFNTPVSAPDRYICPMCGTSLCFHDEPADILIKTTGKTVIVSKKLKLTDLFHIKWIKARITVTNLDISELITFDFKKGRVFLSLKNSNAETLGSFDISNVKCDAYAEDPIFETIGFYNEVQKELKRLFSEMAKCPLPFAAGLLTVEKLILLTRFVGYSSGFYDALPYAEKDWLIDRSFDAAAKSLHYAAKVPALYEKSGLPNTKSIRKIFFESAALLFYIPELHGLWKIINDVNLFRSLITAADIFTELMCLHKRPGLLAFYSEYHAVFGGASLVKMLSQHSYEWHNYAVHYLVLNDYEKKIERKKWKDNFLRHMRMGYLYGCDLPGSRFSVPVPENPADSDRYAGLECCICGYSFIRLKNSAEYIKAGKMLHNCLTDWQGFDGAVYAVMKNDRYLAAIEIKDDKIVQAYAACNKEICNDKNLYDVYHIWKDKNKVTEEADE